MASAIAPQQRRDAHSDTVITVPISGSTSTAFGERIASGYTLVSMMNVGILSSFA